MILEPQFLTSFRGSLLRVRKEGLGEGGRGLQVRAGSAREVRDRVRGWDKESSWCWGSLGGGQGG